MYCYADTTFCISENCQNKCGRKLTPEIRAKANRWWGREGAPIAMSEFCDENGEPFRAPAYLPKEEE